MNGERMILFSAWHCCHVETKLAIRKSLCNLFGSETSFHYGIKAGVMCCDPLLVTRALVASGYVRRTHHFVHSDYMLAKAPEL